MNREEIKNNVLEILTSKDLMSVQIEVKDICEETSLINDVVLDSIQILELIVAIENKFKFNINTEEISIDIFDRFSKLIDYIETNINN